MLKTILTPIFQLPSCTFFLFHRFVIFVCKKVGVSIANIRLYHYHADKECNILQKTEKYVLSRKQERLRESQRLLSSSGPGPGQVKVR